MKASRHLLITGCILAFILVVTAWSSTKTSAKTTSAGSAKVQYGGTLRVITSLPIIFGNPQEYRGARGPITPCLESLANYDEKGELTPVLATSWDIDAAAKTITFHLRKGVKFHDGTDFNSAAVKWNFEKYIASHKLAGGNLIAEKEVVDDYTFRLKLKKFSILFVPEYIQYCVMYSPTYIEKVGLKASRTNPVGTGPFKFDSYKTKSYLKYVKNENYWRQGRPYLDGIEFRVVTEDLVATSMLKAGQADMINPTVISNVSVLKEAGLKIKTIASSYYCLIPDSANPNSPLANFKVRQAIEYAINRQAIAESIGHGEMEALNQFAPSLSVAYDRRYKGRAYNPGKAKQLLAEAGSSNGLTIFLIYNNAWVIQRDLASTIQAELAKVGITVKLDPADNARYDSYWRSNASTWNNALLLYNVRLSPGIAFINGVMRDFRPGGVLASLARSPEIKSLYDQLSKATDTGSLQRLSKAIVKQASDELMTIPVVTGPFPVAFSPKVHTKYPYVSSTAVWDLSEDWKEK